MNADDLSVELTEALIGESLEKKLPPKLAYRLQAWYKKFGVHKPPPALIHKVAKSIEERKNLQKNEVLASFYDNKAVRLDFGKDTSEEVKKKALDWAKRRGLSAIEASLNKSTGAASYVIFGESISGTCVKSIVIKG